MDDLISRQAAIDAIWNTEQHDVKSTATYNRRLKQLVKIINAVNKLPSAEQQWWTPVTERLPYPWDEQYLVSLAWGGVGVMEYKSTGFHNYGSFTPVPIETVTAWMPLPEPYKGESDG